MEDFARSEPAAAARAVEIAADARPVVGMGSAIEAGGWLSRVVWAVLFAVPTAVIVTAAMLTPSSEGHGTHTQLGLPPCGFLVFTGFPCPGCGLTTSFAHMVRLQLGGAWDANPFGILLFTCTALFVPFAAIGFVRGWSVVAALDRVHAEKFAIVLAFLSLITWLSKVAIIYFG